MALIGISGSAHGAPPPNRPTMHELAALGQAVEAELRGLGVADEIDHRADRAAGLLRQLLQRVGRAAVDGRERAGRLGGFALARIDIDHDGALAAHRLQERQRHQAEPAGAEDHDRGVEIGLDLLQRAVGGDAGTGIGRRGDGIEALQIQEILRMRHRHVIGIAAVAIDAERIRLDHAHVLVAGEAQVSHLPQPSQG